MSIRPNIPKRKRIVKQALLADGLWTTYEDGTEEMLPYLIDEVTGEEYASLDPNGDIFGNTEGGAS